MGVDEPAVLRGTASLYQHLATVAYELREAPDTVDTGPVRGQLVGLDEKEVSALFGKRLTLHLEDGRMIDCFFADRTGGVVLQQDVFDAACVVTCW